MSKLPPREQLRRMANAYQISCAVHTAAELGLGAELDGGPVTCSELARRVGVQSDPLRRLLRFLEVIGVAAACGEDSFSATDLCAHLDEIDNLAEGTEALRSWARLTDSLRDGSDAFALANGDSFYDYAARPDVTAKAARWARRNRTAASLWASSIVSALSLRGDERVVDLGAGNGEFLAELIRQHPRAQAVLYDLPGALGHARLDLDRLGLEGRVELVAGDLRHDPPPAADVFVMSRVLLNLPDDDVISVFSSCAARMSPMSGLAVVEAFMPESCQERAPNRAHDLHLWLMWGGKQRTKSAYSKLLLRAGLEPIAFKDIWTAPGVAHGILFCRTARSA